MLILHICFFNNIVQFEQYYVDKLQFITCLYYGKILSYNDMQIMWNIKHKEI